MRLAEVLPRPYNPGAYQILPAPPLSPAVECLLLLRAMTLEIRLGLLGSSGSCLKFLTLRSEKASVVQTTHHASSAGAKLISIMRNKTPKGRFNQHKPFPTSVHGTAQDGRACLNSIKENLMRLGIRRT